MPSLSLNFDLRHPPHFGASGAEIYRGALDMCAWADERGFVKVGVGEHHQSPDGYIPSPLLFAAAIGACTRRLRVRVSVLLAPLYDPVKLAEDVAVADLCLGGRLDLGLGVGYVEADFAAFGKDFATRGRTLDALIPFLRRAWTGEPFEYEGRTIRVTPRPVQDPMPIHVGGASRPGIRRAVELADGYFPPGMSTGWESYRRRVIAAGKPDPGPYRQAGPIFLWVSTKPKDEEWLWILPHVQHQIDSYARWTSDAYGVATGPFAVDPDALKGSYEVVTPHEAVEIAHALGDDGELRFNPLLAGISPSRAWEMLRLVEREVFPHL